MVVWGGGPSNTGGRYDPATDSWRPTSTLNAPSGRSGHTAVWTGSDMIVWGGFLPGTLPTNTGGRYDPATDSWRSTNTLNAPSARSGHSAVWTGSDMIVWGGGSAPPVTYFNTGGGYDPVADSWTPTSTLNAPSARSGHSAVWTGSDMIVWGGSTTTGGRYCASPQVFKDTTAPGIPVAANPTMLGPPNGRMVPVTVSGTMTDEPGGSGVNASSAAYMVLDEYGQLEPRGSITLGANGRYTVTVSLEASRRGNDPDGRRYTIIVGATDNVGNPAAASTIVTVPHDQGQ